MKVFRRVEIVADTQASLQDFDLRLPKVCEALVLVTQCLTTIALQAEVISKRPLSSQAEAITALASSHPISEIERQNLVECLIGRYLCGDHCDVLLMNKPIT